MSNQLLSKQDSLVVVIPNNYFINLKKYKVESCVVNRNKYKIKSINKYFLTYYLAIEIIKIIFCLNNVGFDLLFIINLMIISYFITNKKSTFKQFGLFIFFIN